MTNGLILLGFLAVIFAVVVARVRRRIGISMTAKAIAVTISGFAIVVLILWATNGSN